MKTIDYDQDPRPMGVILAEEGAVDYYRSRLARRDEDVRHLESYLSSGRVDETVLDCGTVRIRFRGADEASYLWDALRAI